MLLPSVKKIKEQNSSFIIDNKITIKSNSELFASAIEYFTVSAKSIFDITVTESHDSIITLEYTELTKESYILDVNENSVMIKAGDLQGAIYALSTLLQLIKKENTLSVPCVHIMDSPSAEIRGVHFYMPSREQIPEFKKIIDTMALLKLNTVIIEVGGGMEYERHPEINEAWVKFCENIKKFPGFNGYKNFQGSDFYWRDSVHTELCDGSYLKKCEVRDLVNYCKSRGMNVIPEVQGLSHSYYLTVAHPEIAELSDDPFPDTYCPNNEKSYELYFDVAEEVIEVFEPHTVSIGHDEIRVLGWCDKCRGKAGHDLVGGEILKLYNFYKKKGIRIAMWGESCQTFVNYKGAEVGKNDVERHDRYGRYYQLPSTYKALDMLPNDILMLDWQHSSGHDSEGCYNERGFDVIYGNFYGSLIGEWENRTSKACYRGGEVSSWCPATEKIFARDGMFFEMAFSSELLWGNCYSNEEYGRVVEQISALTPAIRAINRSAPSTYPDVKLTSTLYLGDEEKKYQTISLNNVKIMDKALEKIILALPKTLHGVSVDSGNILIKNDTYADSLLFLHNTKKEMPYFPSHYFMDEANWGLGVYAVCYEDGTVEVCPIYYGCEVGVKDFKYARHRDRETVSFEIDNELESGKNSTLPCYFTKDYAWCESLTYNTTPIVADDGCIFAYEWKNPHPNKKITKIKPYSTPQVFNKYDMEQSVVLYGVLSLTK